MSTVQEDKASYMTDSDLKDFLLWEQASKDTIDFKRVYVDITGDLVAGLLLSQLNFWFLPNKAGHTKLRVERDGRQWLAKRREDWWDEIRISPKQFDRASTLLAEQGLIDLKIFRFNGSPTVHIALNLRTIWEAVKSKLKNVEGLSSQKVNIHPEEKGTSLTEITTESTSESSNNNNNKGLTHSLTSQFWTLYQKHIGLSYDDRIASEANELVDALETLAGPLVAYEWIEQAFTEMLSANARNWNYLRKVLNTARETQSPPGKPPERREYTKTPASSFRDTTEGVYR